ncbi:dihydrofolate reductase [Rhodococcus sp. Eu-32]|uniref:dihydrofolate reductase family protein n=1 Tax=Rhodococcus sp. Eu-32 TaxID=1017319 RepID=UPI000DF3F058|nr:dihydrofolate reductase family protein [Rhodococcus sp. Eu-32]RRQ27002.1 dihydrofolate reductase [Rhodococcus sp. Eu-32]
MRELVYYVAVSLDGYIAAPDDTFDAFPVQGDHIDMIVREYTDTVPTLGLQALGLTAPLTRFDTVLMGWNTYAAGLPAGATDPYAHLRQYVFTRNHSIDEPGVTVTSDDPVTVVRKLKMEEGSGIYLCGGGELASSLIDEIDRLILKVNPVLLGSGKKLFAEREYDVTTARLVASTPYESGVVINEYTIER